MIDFVRQRPLISGVVAVLLLFLAVSAFPILPETKQAVVVQFGKPSRILGSTQAGINYRIPFFENIVWIDKRVQSVDMDRQQVLSTDQRRLEVDAFARYRIVDPVRMFIAAGNERARRLAAIEARHQHARRAMQHVPAQELLLLRRVA